MSEWRCTCKEQARHAVPGHVLPLLGDSCTEAKFRKTRSDNQATAITLHRVDDVGHLAPKAAVWANVLYRIVMVHTSTASAGLLHRHGPFLIQAAGGQKASRWEAPTESATITLSTHDPGRCVCGELEYLAIRESRSSIKHFRGISPVISRMWCLRVIGPEP